MAGKVTRVAVLGLYNSGSTGLAGMLHRLGVNMGPPFWAVTDDRADMNFYEPYDLSWHLRMWWGEPRFDARAPAALRVGFLRQWAVLQECLGAPVMGAKHPLLSLCGEDLLAAWGPDTRFIWSWRSLEASIAGLERRGWFREHTRPLQQRLWDALREFDVAHPGLMVRLDWDRVKADPSWAARELASLAGVEASGPRLREAAGYIRPPGPAAPPAG